MKAKGYKYIIPKHRYQPSKPVFISSKGKVVARGYDEYKVYLKGKK